MYRLINYSGVLIMSFLLVTGISIVYSQETPLRYEFNQLANVDYPHGQLPSAMGVHNIQILRANREISRFDDDFGWTYHHAPMIAHWNDSLYVNYLGSPVGEHKPPGQTFLQSSRDGYNWSEPRVLFPLYRIPDGTTKEGARESAEDLDALMHQRMGFYVSPVSNRLFALGYYGISLPGSKSPNDGNGIGRVVREIRKDGSLGQIYFIRYNHGWGEHNTGFPFYKKSRDKEFVEACERMLADPLVTLQWAEESDRDDPIIPDLGSLKKAFCYYRMSDGKVIGMWKSGYSGLSMDSGQTWTIGMAPGLITGSAKMWGEHTSDDRYAQVFNPTVHNRYPLVVSPSGDGYLYDRLLVIHGELSPKRYAGNSKKEGPQYVRGILPGNGTVPDGNLWVTYSVNKEDIWVSRVAVPILGKTGNHIDEDLSSYTELSQLHRWNIYSPAWAPVSVDEAPNGKNALRLSDKDRYDYAKAEHLFPESGEFTIEFSLIPGQDHTGSLEIELQDRKNRPGIRIGFDPDGVIRYKRLHRHGKMFSYKAGKIYSFRLEINTGDQSCRAFVNGVESRVDFHAPIDRFSKIVFRTGEPFSIHDEDMLEDHDRDKPGSPEDLASFYILSLKTSDRR